MGKATLNYIINDKELMICKDSLYGIDKYTCKYKNDDELRQNSPLKSRIHSFIKENEAKGKFIITYIDGYKKKNIMPLYNDIKPIVLVDDILNNKNSEIENSRKLLFNSKNQIFSKEVYKNENINNSLNLEIKVNDEDASILKFYKIPVKDEYLNHYVSFKDVVRYRINNNKLGLLRPIYEDMLDLYKKELEKLNADDLYFYSREFRIIYNDYLELRKNFTVARLRFYGNINVLRRDVSLKDSPYNKCGKIKVYKKN